MGRVTALIIVSLISGVSLFVFSCATAPTGPIAPGEVGLLKIDIPHEGSIKRSMPFVVNINFEADGKPEIRSACFNWSGDGPYCYKVADVNYGFPRTIRVEPLAKEPGSYALETYVNYVREGRTQRTKVISTQINIIP
jgi:hypothetical protein